jgi:hypothetical protein
MKKSREIENKCGGQIVNVGPLKNDRIPTPNTIHDRLPGPGDRVRLFEPFKL